MPSKKVDDVSKPGTTPADATAKPVIVGHRAMVVDPMVNKDAEKKAEPETEKAEPSAAKTIKPVSEEEKTSEPAVPEPKPEPKAMTSTESEMPAPQSEDLPQENINKQQEDSQVEAEDERQARLKELIDSKKYNVTFKDPEGGSAKAFFATVFIVILIGIVAFALLDDAGVIDLGLKLPFDFIK